MFAEWPSFKDLINRADEETLQFIIGRQEMRLLNMLDPTLSSPATLKRLVHSQVDPVEVMREKSLRDALLQSLRREEAVALADYLDLNIHEPYAALTSQRSRRGSNAEKAMLQALDVTLPAKEESEKAPGTRIVMPNYGLFEHQREAVSAVIEKLRSPRPRVLLHMPTGSGKTRTAMDVVSHFLRSTTSTLVVWLAYSEELCEQASEEFEEAWSSIGNRDTPIHRFFGKRGNLDIQTVSDGLVVAGLDKAYSRAKSDSNFLLTLGDRAALVVIDEAHQAIAPTYRRVLELLVERRAKTGLLGLTATPGRTWDDPEDDLELADFFFRQKVTLKAKGYENPVDYLIDEKYLARPIFEPLTYEGGPILTEADVRDIAAGLDVPDRILENLGENELRNLMIVRKVEELVRDHDRIIVFSPSVKNSHLICSVLDARGIWARAVTGQTNPGTRERIISEYKRDTEDARVLVNYGVLTTGFDAPTTSACVIARPTKSLVLYSQMVGRAIRGPEAGGNATATICTVVETWLPGFSNVSEAFSNWEDVW